MQRRQQSLLLANTCTEPTFVEYIIWIPSSFKLQVVLVLVPDKIMYCRVTYIITITFVGHEYSTSFGTRIVLQGLEHRRRRTQHETSTRQRTLPALKSLL
jgi:hypothetical protein